MAGRRGSVYTLRKDSASGGRASPPPPPMVDEAESKSRIDAFFAHQEEEEDRHAKSQKAQAQWKDAKAKVVVRLTHGALPHRAPSPRYTC